MAAQPRILERLRSYARRLKTSIYALYLAYRDPRTPWYARLIAAVVVGYALSPIDLIPDFIPVLGYLDDLVLVPIGLAIAIRLIPPEVMADSLARAAAEHGMLKRNRMAAVLIIAIWVSLAMICLSLVLRAIQ